MTSYLARMMIQKFQIETRGTWGCPLSPAKRILKISFTDKALGFSQDWHFLNLWSAPLSSRIYFFPKFSWIYRFSDMLNLFMKRNFHKNQFFAILSFCEIYIFFPQCYFKSAENEENKIVANLIWTFVYVSRDFEQALGCLRVFLIIQNLKNLDEN